MLLLADFARYLALDVAEDALAAFDFGADDAETVEWDDGLFGLLGLLWLLWLLAGIGVSRGLLRLFGMFGGIVDVDVEGRYVDVGLDFGVGAIEFDGLFLSGDGIDGSAENVALGVAIDVAGGLLDFDELRLSLKVIE